MRDGQMRTIISYEEPDWIKTTSGISQRSVMAPIMSLVCINYIVGSLIAPLACLLMMI